jgi:hypothetical protein
LSVPVSDVGHPIIHTPAGAADASKSRHRAAPRCSQEAGKIVGDTSTWGASRFGKPHLAEDFAGA